MEPALRTPVVMTIFNRPATTSRVFEAVRATRPERLLLIADGPRDDRPHEARLCRETRAVVERVDWECEVATEYSDTNLGCRGRVSSGLDWAFDLVEEAIVLEDDCLPNPSFFRYSEELLDRYRDDGRVMHISGDNFERAALPEGRLARLAWRLRRRGGPSYYFSRYAHVWGWACWRRAWALYDGELSGWGPGTAAKETFLEQFADPSERSFWQSTLDQVAAGEIESWAYRWTFSCLAHGGLSAMPRRNLISNIGFGADALHTTDPASPLADLPREDLRFPLHHPPSVSRDERIDAQTAHLAFGASPPGGAAP